MPSLASRPPPSRPPDIVACYVVCNEADHIATSMRSIGAYVDRYIVIDSAFPANPLPPGITHSTDATRAIAEAIATSPFGLGKPLKYIEATERLEEPAARNVYLDLVQPPDWVFVIDGDEELLGQHAAILDLLTAIKRGAIHEPLAIPVYTTALALPKMAPDIGPTEFAVAPLIATMGWMPRLFPAAPNLRYTRPVGASTPALTYLADRPTVPNVYLYGSRKVPTGDMLLVNRHANQTYEAYQNDFVWETGGVQK